VKRDGIGLERGMGQNTQGAEMKGYSPDEGPNELKQKGRWELTEPRKRAENPKQRQPCAKALSLRKHAVGKQMKGQ
jgi:hypothetical protein